MKDSNKLQSATISIKVLEDFLLTNAVNIDDKDPAVGFTDALTLLNVAIEKLRDIREELPPVQ